MINLIRNELTKIFSKKAIYVYTVIVFLMLIFMSVLAKKLNNSDVGLEDVYVDSLKDSLDNYDLSDKQQLNFYIGDRVLIDVSELRADYHYDSPEYYYIEEVIQPLIENKYGLEYRDKDVEAAKNVQLEIDKEIKKLDNFAWKAVINERKNEIDLEIKDAKDLLLLDKDNEEIKSAIEILELELWCLNYRLDNEIPLSYSPKSNLVDSYYDYSLEYKSIVKDESVLNDKDEIRKKRETEANYFVTKYKLENEIVDDQNMIEFIVESMSYVDGLIIVAIIILSGSIISEEFNKGTIKQLLTKPHSRIKILTSKIIACLIAITLFVILYEAVFILANCYENSNFTSILGNTVVYDFNLGKVKEVSVLSHCLYGFVSVLPAYLIIFVLVLFIGALSTSSVASMAIGFGIFLFYDLLSLWLSPKVLAYIPFYTWNLSPYMYGGMNSNKYATFGTSLVIDIVTILVFGVLAYILFNKKEIKNQ